MNEFEHPYKIYESTTLWRVIDEAISDLVENKDIEETTRREYIVGYLAKYISEKIMVNLCQDVNDGRGD